MKQWISFIEYNNSPFRTMFVIDASYEFTFAIKHEGLILLEDCVRETEDYIFFLHMDRDKKCHCGYNDTPTLRGWECYVL